MFVFFAVLGVGLLVHKAVEVGGRVYDHLEDPTVRLSLVVDDSGVAFDVLVVGSDHACHWSVHVGSCLHGLNAANSVSLVELSTDISNIQMDNISKLTLSEVSDADLGLLLKRYVIFVQLKLMMFYFIFEAHKRCKFIPQARFDS